MHDNWLHYRDAANGDNAACMMIDEWRGVEMDMTVSCLCINLRRWRAASRGYGVAFGWLRGAF